MEVYGIDIEKSLKIGKVYEDSEGSLIFYVNGCLYSFDSDGKLYDLGDEFWMLEGLQVKESNPGDALDLTIMTRDKLIEREGLEEYCAWYDKVFKIYG